ncbi:MAG TPA: response regulator [Desulfobacterales bacterium]|nr:response regulator [Desulfobacterales bacterium]
MKRRVGTAMVVGAGIAGIRAALDLAEYGYGVTLVDRAPHVGGILSQLDYQFPTDHCGMCQMLPLVRRDAASQHCLRRGLFHENIDILLSTEVTAIEGDPGKFRVTVKQQPSWVNPGRCVGCGRCVPVCPVKVRDGFNAGLATRKAIYLPVPHNIPNAYVVDTAACTRCGACAEVCPTDAIRMPETERKKFRILVVDDELVVRDSLKEWLAEEGYTVAMAASGSEALDALDAGTFHLMLLDIKMPGMDGVEVLERAKSRSPDLAVVMMTAYATVETAVDAMKIGALDYLIKPFEVDSLLPKVEKVYQRLEAAEARQIETGALVLCGGTDFYDPAAGKNTFGYRMEPNVLTQVEFERLLSGTGPTGGRLVRLSDGRPVGKIAWIQCVGSRDVQLDADFCSNICCMVSIKEAVLAKERAGGDLEAAIFFMDMRTFGKSFQRFRDDAEHLHGVRFERARAHSVVGDSDGGLHIRWTDPVGACRDEPFDMVVLAVGQRPAHGSADLSGRLELPLNPWGFIEAELFSLSRTRQPGIFVGGAFGGMKDIGEAVIQASAAAANASRVIHTAGGSLALEESASSLPVSLSREPARIMVAVCRCGRPTIPAANVEFLAHALRADPAVPAVEVIEDLCTQGGLEQLAARVRKVAPNRLLIGACLPHVHQRVLKDLSRECGLDPSLVEVITIAAWEMASAEEPSPREALAQLRAGVARLKWLNLDPVPEIRVEPRALVVGGGIAGMTAALTVAEHGYGVDLVEASERLGGNLTWIRRTLEGQDVQALLNDTVKRIEKHPRIHVHTESRVMHAHGEVGAFATVVEGPENRVLQLEHGVAILATGGTEAPAPASPPGVGPAVLTQSDVERRLADGRLDAALLDTVVMIQCVGSRQEPRNYCSRVCCATALKHALLIQERNPQANLFVLHRDMMTTGFSEAAFTRARAAGVVFVPYSVDRPPLVETAGAGVSVTVDEPVLGRPLKIEAQLVILATGIVPAFPRELAEAFGVRRDRDGFFEEAESKWRPVDSLKEGVFACGLALSPRTIAESIATAEAAAQRALRILSRERLATGKVVASVRHSLCSLCEQCINACPYGARAIDENQERLVVNPAMCQGCGACAAVCPNDASVVEGFPAQQMLAMIDAAI